MLPNGRRVLPEDVRHSPCCGRKKEIALDSQAGTLDALQFREAGVAPLVAVLSERGEAIAEEEKVAVPVWLALGDEEDVAAYWEKVLRNNDRLHPVAILRVDRVLLEGCTNLRREKVHRSYSFREEPTRRSART